MIPTDLREIPAEGLALRGEITEDIFQLDAEDSAKPVGPVRYDARAFIMEDGELVVEGDFAADFEVECARCLEKFLFSVELHAHGLTENLENPTEADLTQAIREDILLALPAYPRCEEGTVPRKCPAEGKFDAIDSAPLVEESAGEQPNPWADLDNLDGLKKETSD